MAIKGTNDKWDRSRLVVEEIEIGVEGSTSVITGTDAAILDKYNAGDGIVKTVAVALGDAVGAGKILAWANPEGATIFVKDVQVVTTTATTGAQTLDLGVAANGTTSSNTIIDGADINDAVHSLSGATDPGTSGAQGRPMTSTQFITGSGNSDPDGLVGTAYITYATF